MHTGAAAAGSGPGTERERRLPPAAQRQDVPAVLKGPCKGEQALLLYKHGGPKSTNDREGDMDERG